MSHHDEDMGSINELAEILEHHQSYFWEVWDFIEQKCVERFPTELAAANYVAKRYEEHFDRVRYVIVPPSVSSTN